MSTTLLRGGRLVQDGCITRCDILLRGKAVDAVLPPDSGAAADFVYDLAGLYVSAGFIDIHVHGGGGHDFMDGTPEAYHGASALHLRHGTTAMVPTTLAASKEELLRSFSVFERCRDGFADGAKLLGLHIEGPYIAKASAAHRTRASSASRTPPNTTSCLTPARTSFAGPSRPSCPAHGRWGLRCWRAAYCPASATVRPTAKRCVPPFPAATAM
ncbi:MAG: hypothetical protein ACLVJ8_05810 [Ruthenibacterium lactatiformans]